MKHLAPKRSKSVAFKVVNEEDDGHSNEDCSDEELTILTRRFMNFLKNQDPRSRDSKGINSKNRFIDYTDGYGHISSECANTLKKQKDGRIRHCIRRGVTVILTMKIMFRPLHLSPHKQNEELVKSIVVLKLENCKIANKFQSSDTHSEKNRLIASLTSNNKALELELENSKEMIVSLTIGAEKIDKMISIGRRDGDKRGLGFKSSNKSSAVSKTKFVKSSSPIEPSAAHEVKKFIPICHFGGTRGH
ncbi:hypothetical protein L3X38_003054 [Prunus dulcis]|uniref:Uncharacterized protein n=1 Tax=Prunus dulcis TaxID=3755 RepID=A0AAD4WV47_PRUDU|nr:hypothetical protein L3X38_003054 [Prunus dulcis]